jgi:hypothetical protein
MSSKRFNEAKQLKRDIMEYETISIFSPGVESIDIKVEVVGDGILCASNGLKCDGICRKINLYRKRTDMKRCPAAYEEGPKRRTFRDIKKERQIRDRKWRKQHENVGQ